MPLGEDVVLRMAQVVQAPVHVLAAALELGGELVEVAETLEEVVVQQAIAMSPKQAMKLEDVGGGHRRWWGVTGGVTLDAARAALRR